MSHIIGYILVGVPVVIAVWQLAKIEDEEIREMFKIFAAITGLISFIIGVFVLFG